MKKSFFSIRAGSLLALSTSITAGAAEISDTVGKVISVRGTVLVRSGEAADSLPLKAGTYFHKTDVINTSSDGGVKLLFDDKSIVDLGPSTLFKVTGYKANEGNNREVDLALPYGNFKISVAKPITGKGKFQIRTKTATMGVRGTVFAGVASEKGLQMATQSGAVAITSNGAAAAQPVLITANTGMSVNNSGQSTVAKLTPIATNTIMAKSEIKPVTFSANVTFNKNSAVSGSVPSKPESGKTETTAKSDPSKGREPASGEGAASEGNAAATASSAAVGAATSNTESAPASSTAGMVSNIVIADTTAHSSTTAAPLPNLTNFAPPRPTIAGPAVVIPVGGLKQVTIQVTR